MSEISVPQPLYRHRFLHEDFVSISMFRVSNCHLLDALQTLKVCKSYSVTPYTHIHIYTHTHICEQEVNILN